MDRTVGIVGVITHFCGASGVCVRFEAFKEKWLYPYFALEKIEEKPKCQFKPYDKVLVKDNPNSEWHCEFFSHYREGQFSPWICIGGGWKYCIPYEGNEHLVGTTEEPNE